MTIDLSPEEIDMIADWYTSAAGESATSRDWEMFALLDKLGIHADPSDLCVPDPMDTYEEYRDDVYATIEAIKAYCDRHPDYEEVKEVLGSYDE